MLVSPLKSKTGYKMKRRYFKNWLINYDRESGLRKNEKAYIDESEHRIKYNVLRSLKIY